MSSSGAELTVVGYWFAGSLISRNGTLPTAGGPRSMIFWAPGVRPLPSGLNQNSAAFDGLAIDHNRSGRDHQFQQGGHR